MPATLPIAIFVFCFGLIIGSFLNVCILRIPEGKSVVTPSSACPKCGKVIRPYDNIPVLSWLLLGGKCRACKTKISGMYPLVELLTGLLFLGCYLAFRSTTSDAPGTGFIADIANGGFSVEMFKWALFAALLIVLIFTDLRERILPDVVNFTGFGLGLAFSLVTKPVDGTALWLANRMFDFPPPVPVISLADALIGAALGSGLLWLVSEAYFRLRGREGMGLGDVKMMLMVGAFLGAKRTLLTIFAGSILGSILGLLFMAARGKDSGYELPFGTFLGMAALLVVFFGTPFVIWYQSLVTGIR